MKASNNDVRLLNSAIIGVVSGSGVKLTPEPGGFENLKREAWMLLFVYGNFTNKIVSEDNLTPELRPSMNSVFLRWAPY